MIEYFFVWLIGLDYGIYLWFAILILILAWMLSKIVKSLSITKDGVSVDFLADVKDDGKYDKESGIVFFQRRFF